MDLGRYFQLADEFRKKVPELLPTGTGTDVLVVDDDQDILEMFKATLPPFEINPICVESAGEAAAVLCNNPNIKAILLDWMLPECDGIMFMKELKENKWKQPVIMVTARNRRKDVEIALDHGVMDYIVKPFEIESLAKKIVKLVNKDKQPEKKMIHRECGFPADIRIEMNDMSFSGCGFHTKMNLSRDDIVFFKIPRLQEITAKEHYLCARVMSHNKQQDLLSRYGCRFVGLLQDDLNALYGLLNQSWESSYKVADICYRDQNGEKPEKINIILYSPVEENDYFLLRKLRRSGLEITRTADIEDITKASEYDLILFDLTNISKDDLYIIRAITKDNTMPQVISLAKDDDEEARLRSVSLCCYDHYSYEQHFSEMVAKIKCALKLHFGKVENRSSIRKNFQRRSYIVLYILSVSPDYAEIKSSFPIPEKTEFIIHSQSFNEYLGIQPSYKFLLVADKCKGDNHNYLVTVKRPGAVKFPVKEEMTYEEKVIL